MTAGDIVSGAQLASNRTLTPDFCVVGSGAGGSVAAATLAEAGASVVILEEGGHHTRRDFNLQEAWAYPALYQDRGNRATDDLSIMVLQGRGVGGGTTVNWTSAFRPPPATLALWRARHAVAIGDGELTPHVAAVETRLSIADASPDDVNRNNRVLQEGAARLGWRTELIRRSVKGCARLGYCGMGCPLDAKQSALVTYVPDAIAAGATLYADCRVVALEGSGDRIRTVVAQVLERGADRSTGVMITVAPRRGVVLAAGAINTPALLLRARIPDPHGLIGRRTFLHPTVPLVGLFDEPIEAYYGAPQSVSCHEFADRGERVGYLLETPPVHPMLAAIAFPGFGRDHRDLAARLPFVHATIALLIDGQHDDQGGRVTVDGDGRARLEYPLAEALREAGRDAIRNMARLVLAAGAREAVTLHDPPLRLARAADLARLAAAPFVPGGHTIFSAHQMGGCPMGEDPRRAVVSSRGRHHRVANLWIADGSVFPTGLGVNPQLTIYALARLFATGAAKAA